MPDCLFMASASITFLHISQNLIKASPSFVGAIGPQTLASGQHPQSLGGHWSSFLSWLVPLSKPQVKPIRGSFASWGSHSASPLPGHRTQWLSPFAPLPPLMSTFESNLQCIRVFNIPHLPNIYKSTNRDHFRSGYRHFNAINIVQTCTLLRRRYWKSTWE